MGGRGGEGACLQQQEVAPPAGDWPPCLLQEFSFPQVWCSDQQPLLCCFSLQRRGPAPTQLSCKVCVRQVKGHEQILQVYTPVAEVRLCPRFHLHQ